MPPLPVPQSRVVSFSSEVDFLNPSPLGGGDASSDDESLESPSQTSRVLSSRGRNSNRTLARTYGKVDWLILLAVVLLNMMVVCAGVFSMSLPGSHPTSSHPKVKPGVWLMAGSRLEPINLTALNESIAERLAIGAAEEVPSS